MPRRTIVKVAASALIAALEEKKAAAERRHLAAVVEYQRRADEVVGQQQEALYDALQAARRGELVEVARYSDSEASDGCHLLRLPPTPYQPRLDVARYQQAIDILKLADPDSLIPMETDNEYARLLSG